MARKKVVTHEIAWAELLARAVNEPGIMMKAYSNFHSYSLGNCILAFCQAAERELEFGPIATYKRWKELGRQVDRHSKGITLCQPVMVPAKDKQGEPIIKNGKPEKRRIFVFRNSWFLLSQTSGDEVKLETGPEWDKDAALKALDITEESFKHANGNVQGYAKESSIAINPVAQAPHKTLFHELAHVVLGHTADSGVVDEHDLPRDLREVEAESVAYIILDALGLDGSEFARGYIQHWLGDSEIPEGSAARIFTAASKILSAGSGQERSD